MTTEPWSSSSTASRTLTQNPSPEYYQFLAEPRTRDDEVKQSDGIASSCLRKFWTGRNRMRRSLSERLDWLSHHGGD